MGTQWSYFETSSRAWTLKIAVLEGEYAWASRHVQSRATLHHYRSLPARSTATRRQGGGCIWRCGWAVETCIVSRPTTRLQALWGQGEHQLVACAERGQACTPLPRLPLPLFGRQHSAQAPPSTGAAPAQPPVLLPPAVTLRQSALAGPTLAALACRQCHFLYFPRWPLASCWRRS